MLIPALKYMGSKVKAIRPIMGQLPEKIDEYREPFVGGGSILLGMLQCHEKPNKIAIGDLDYDVYNFWHHLIHNTSELVTCSKAKLADLDTVIQEGMLGKAGAEAASIYLILNHLRRYGNCGGLDRQIEDCEPEVKAILESRIWGIKNIIGTADIRNDDYSWALLEPTSTGSKETLVFLDPPYMDVSKPYYIGHETFDFNRLIQLLKETKHKFIMTIDNNDLREQLSNSFNVSTYDIFYGSSHRTATELIVKNY